MGGWSSERPISLKSGNAVVAGLKEIGCNVVPLDLKDPLTVREEIEQAGLDVCFIALHGHFGEDGGIQSLLEQLKIPYTGSSSEASRKAMDKVQFRKIMAEAKIRMPEGVVLKTENGKWKMENGGGVDFHSPLPWIVKPAIEGSSIGVSIVDTPEELREAVNDAARYSNAVVVEQYIQGEEITVGILQDHPLPPVEIVPKNRFYDYDSKYGGGTQYIVPARIGDEKKQEARQIGIRVHQTLGCRHFSRVDMILGKNGDLFVLELNTIPGLTDKSLLPKAAMAAGISFTELCLKIMESAAVMKDG